MVVCHAITTTPAQQVSEVALSQYLIVGSLMWFLRLLHTQALLLAKSSAETLAMFDV
jgi:predicted transcriptional regulator